LKFRLLYKLFNYKGFHEIIKLSHGLSRNINSKGMRRRLMLLIYAFILIIYKCTSITLVSLIVDTGTIVLYNNSVYSTQFFTSHSKFSCSYTNLYTYKQSVQNL